jgi:flagellar hook-associated protein 3 FlgL
MRVTFQSTFRNGLFDVGNASEVLSARSNQVASGKRMQTPSDDPIAAAGGVRERTEMATLDKYISTGDSVDSRLSVTDSLLSDIIKQIEAAQSAGVAGRSTILNQTQRDAIAGEIRGERDSIMRSMNTAYQGVYLFSGGQSNTPPYAAGPPISAYQGDAQVQSVDVTRGRSVQVTFNGQSIIQGSAANDLFTTLTNLADAVQTGNMTGIDSAMIEVNAGHDRVQTAQSKVGTDLAMLSEDHDRLAELRRAADSRRSKFEDANITEAISGMTQSTQAYNAALGALAKAGQLSLLDYLK